MQKESYIEGFILVLALAALPASGNFLGGIFAEVFPVSSKALNLALHAAAGIVMGVVTLELFPEALRATPAWIPIVAFVIGGVAFLGIEALSRRLQSRRAKTVKGGVGGIYMSVALDLFSDGILIGTGTVINPALGLLLALGQMPADVPEGYAVSAALRRANIRKVVRFLLLLSFIIPIFIGAALGYFALQDAPEIVTLSVLALTGGILMSAVTEDVLSEAHEQTDSRYAVVFLVGGFALFAFISVYFGG